MQLRGIQAVMEYPEIFLMKLLGALPLIVTNLICAFVKLDVFKKIRSYSSSLAKFSIVFSRREPIRIRRAEPSTTRRRI